jgi:hypothetical protein
VGPLKLWLVMSDMQKTKLNSPILRSKEYFLVPGDIYKWHALYQELPPVSNRYTSLVCLWSPTKQIKYEAFTNYNDAGVADPLHCACRHRSRTFIGAQNLQCTIGGE